MRFIACLLAMIIVASIACLAACGRNDGNTVVVYTSLDQPFSEPILKAFEAQTGIDVKAVYDLEAAKTTGLANRLVEEKRNPQADVFWSSEYAQTIGLKHAGVLAPYTSPSANEIPSLYRDLNDHWTGFALRARVIIVNTDLVPEEEFPQSIFDLLDPKWKGEAGVANPLFGTTATHAAALFAFLGADEAKAFFERLLENDVSIVDGNSVVRDMVSNGELKLGLTDTDDAFVAIERGDPVTMIFPDQADMGTLLIPNTVAMIEGAPHPEKARQFIDYLLSEDVEKMLAHAESRQMPVRVDVAVPGDMPSLGKLVGMAVYPQEVADQMEVSGEWLKETFLR